jgi:signal transduction histidine kinase
MAVAETRATPSRVRRRRLIDAALCLFVTLVSVSAALSQNGDDRHPGIPSPITRAWALGVGLAFLAGLPIAVRRRFPVGVLIVVEAAIAAHLVAVDSNLRGGDVGLAVAVYTVATRRPRSVSLRAAVAVGALNTVIYVGMLAAGRFDTLPNLVFADVLVAGSWALGDNIATRRAYLASVVERASRLERDQQERAQRAVFDERARIARELHDVVAHHVSAIAVQAGAAEEIADQDPHRARQVLATIQATSRQALAEMRAMVGVLRNDDDSGTLAPQPGLAQLDRLVAQSRAAGLAVHVRVEGEARPLPEALELSAFRIVQEALTNTLKHAGATNADVVVRYGDGQLEVMVSDDGKADGAEASSETGRGLVGMRERVALFHGQLDVGRSASGGFRVHARLPVEGVAE